MQRYYTNLSSDELNRANQEVMRKRLGREVPLETLERCARRMGEIITAGETNLARAIDRAIQRELPRRQMRGGCTEAAYRAALRAAIWYRYDKIVPVIKAQRGERPSRPFRSRSIDVRVEQHQRPLSPSLAAQLQLELG